MFKQILHKDVSLPPEWLIGKSTLSVQQTLPLHSICKTKSCSDVLIEATVRNVRVDGIMLKAYRRIRFLKGSV